MKMAHPNIKLGRAGRSGPCRAFLGFSIALLVTSAGSVAWGGMRSEGPEGAGGLTAPMEPAQAAGSQAGGGPRVVAGQPRRGKTVEPPSVFHQEIDALGQRAKSAGKERTVMTGDYIGSQGARINNVQIIHQAPGLVEARGIHPEGPPLKFNGKRVVAPLSKEDEGMLESLTADTAEALLDASRSGAALRVLGYDFRSSQEKPGEPGPHYDAYQVVLESKTNPEGKKGIKTFWFDSKTHLLARTTYIDGRSRVETKFSNWTTVEGSKYPGQIERYEEGRLIFAFRAASIAGGPKADPASFQ